MERTRWQGWGGAGPGAAGGEDGCPVWLGARWALQRRGQDAGCSELRGGWGRAEEAGIRSGAVCAKAQRQETWEPS